MNLGLEGFGLPALCPLPIHSPQAEDPGLKPHSPFLRGSLAPSWAPVPINQVWLSSPQKMLSAVTFILLLAGTIKSRATQRRNAVTWESHLLCPHPPLPQPGNMGQAFSHWGSEGHTHMVMYTGTSPSQGTSYMHHNIPHGNSHHTQRQTTRVERHTHTNRNMC